MLIVFRFVLGFGVGGDYPVSAVLMSEYANRRDRGKLVGMVFSTQALGLIVGPADRPGACSAAGWAATLAWRIMLGLGAVPAAAVVYLRRKMPESPRYQAQVQGRHTEAVAGLAQFSQRPGRSRPRPPSGTGWAAGVPDQPPVAGHAGGHGGLLVPAGLRLLRQHDLHAADHRADLAALLPTMTTIAIQLAIFVVAAVPGYLLASPGWTGSATGGSSSSASR